MTAAPTVLTVHGIRTRAAWQKADLSEILGDAGFKHIPLDYGYFLALSLIIPSLREKKVRWFWDQYARFAADLDEPPHIIAHSFGTYIVCEALRMHGEIKYGKLILCGSIVDPKYPWREIFDQGRVASVLNDYGSADIWTLSVGFAVSDAGPSGRTGFVDVEGLPVRQRRLPGWRHSDFFNRLHFGSWVRFLRDGTAGPAGVESGSTVTWRAWVGRIVASIVLVTFLAIALFFLLRPIPLPDNLIAAKYGVVGAVGTWTARSFEREVGDPDATPREGDTVIAIRPIRTFARLPRRWLELRMGAASEYPAGERFRVRRLHSPLGKSLWIVAAQVPKPEGLDRFQYKYRYSYDEGCSGFLMSDGSGEWIEFTPGDDNCTKTVYPFRQAAKTAEFYYLYDRSGRGYYFRIPAAGGRSSLAGPYLAEDVDVETLTWSRHYKVRRLLADDIASP